MKKRVYANFARRNQLVKEHVPQMMRNNSFNFTNLLETNLPVKISDILTNFTDLFENRDWWQDGQAGVSWLTGTHIGRSWVKSGTSKSDNDDDIEKVACDHQVVMQLAAERLRDMLWFGILEDIDRSIEILRHQLGVKTLVNIHL